MKQVSERKEGTSDHFGRAEAKKHSLRESTIQLCSSAITAPVVGLNRCPPDRLLRCSLFEYRINGVCSKHETSESPAT